MSTVAVSSARRRERGYSLIEIGLAIILIVAAIAAVVSYFQGANMGAKIQSAIAQIGQIQTAVASQYNGQPTYLDSSGGTDMEPTLAGSKLLPNRMVSGTALRHAVGGDINVTANATGSLYSITFDKLPAEACRRLAGIDFGSALFAVVVAPSGVAAPSDTACTTGTNVKCGASFGPADANTACGDSNGASIAWTFY